MAVSEKYLDEIKAKVSILDMAREKTPLVFLRGRYWGVCPFHEEETPSFSVIPERGVFYCFGCHKGGGIFQFVMEIEKVTFPEAVAILVKRAGIEPTELDRGVKA